MSVAKELMPAEWFASERISVTEHQYDALNDADALALITEWKPFCYPDMTAMKNLMRQPVIFDGRNQYDPKQIRSAGFDYYGIGRGKLIHASRALQEERCEVAAGNVA
jgi:UDPglucose 6-dehydrogenase